MSDERVMEIRKMLFDLDRRIKPLEWDDSRHQINEFKKQTLAKLKTEQVSLTGELQGLLHKPEQTADDQGSVASLP